MSPSTTRRGLLAAVVAGMVGSLPARAAPPVLPGDATPPGLNFLVTRELLHDPASPVLGNPEGDVTLVEFFDYRCPYCRVMEPRLTALIDADPMLRVVMKEYPVLGPTSVIAAKLALVAARHGTYARFHAAMFAVPGSFTRADALGVGRAAGLDPATMEREMEEDDFVAAIRGNLALGNVIGVTGTPTFVAGTAIVPGAIGAAEMRKLVDHARTG